MSKPTGYVLWEGPSAWDESPIAFIATGIGGKSQNRKTGNMVQTWVIRQDAKPTDAVKSGADESICGHCPHRGTHGADRSCYVNVGQAPNSIHRAYAAGKYPRIDNLAGVFAGRAVRLGAYGDPAMVPFDIVSAVTEGASLWTGYTHQWRTTDARFSRLLMASCDSTDDYILARRLGWRGFVVVARDAAFPAGTVECMSTARGTQCADCGACAGTRNGARPNAVSIAIHAHGTGAKYVKGV